MSGQSLSLTNCCISRFLMFYTNLDENKQYDASSLPTQVMFEIQVKSNGYGRKMQKEGTRHARRSNEILRRSDKLLRERKR